MALIKLVHRPRPCIQSATAVVDKTNAVFTFARFTRNHTLLKTIAYSYTVHSSYIDIILIYSIGLYRCHQ